MRSLRSRLELACRLTAFALIGWLMGTTLFPIQGRRLERATSTNIAALLPGWTVAPGNVSMHVDVTSVPSRWTLDWIAALRRIGRQVGWSGSPAPVGIALESTADPSGSVRVDVAAPDSVLVALRDGAGAADSVRVRGLGATIIEPLVVDSVIATADGQHVGAPTPPPAAVRPVVVIGRAGWEGKFVVSALEERGWRTDPRFSVAPGVDVSAASSLKLDTTHVSAIIALDTSIASLGGAVERFVHDGGGLVLAGNAAAAVNVAALAPGTPGARVPPPVPGAVTLGIASAGYYPMIALRRDAVVIEHRNEGAVVAARRVGAGRVIQVAFDESWRWRMAGESGSEAAHRQWWSRVVGSVAYLPDVPSNRNVVNWDAAPLASLVDRAGPSRTAPVLPTARWSPDTRVLLSLICILLLLEWASRRLRGAR